MNSEEHYLSNVLLTDEDRAYKKRIRAEEVKKSAESGKHYLADVLDVEPIRKAHELKDAKIDFVSLVDRPANKRTFLIAKAAETPAIKKSVAVVCNNLLYSANVYGLEYEDMNEKETGLYNKIVSDLLDEFGGGEEACL